MAALDAVHALEQCLATVKLTLVREFDGSGVAVPHGASSTAVWLRERWRLPIGRARRLVADAAALGATAPTADAVARAALDSEEARAARDRHLTLSDLHDGRFRLAGTLDAETAASLTSALAPLTTPAGSDDSRTPGQRRHDALGDLCRLALRSEELPEHGGDAAQIVVTTSYDAVSRQLGVGSLDTGTALTPATVRRLACDAAVLPAVLGGNGKILDLGRQRRLITGPLRRALVLRDNGCAFPGCDRPPRWCDGHHVVHWADGGKTALRNSVLLCRHHHRQMHHSDWRVRIAADGRPEFVPPAWLDPQGVPRRNPYHRRT
ncbi:DUF222 domain-containing protein [Micromonospora sp. DT47]|uniref:HNH endonuclease signature motif containing protein n=1 Tax=Micromonospora sp. DT47 TaxID=3393431 RepID=UPI003CF556BB